MCALGRSGLRGVEKNEELKPRCYSHLVVGVDGGPLPVGQKRVDVSIEVITMRILVFPLHRRRKCHSGVVELVPLAIAELYFCFHPLLGVIAKDDCLRFFCLFSFLYFGKSDDGDHVVYASHELFIAVVFSGQPLSQFDKPNSIYGFHFSVGWRIAFVVPISVFDRAFALLYVFFCGMALNFSEILVARPSDGKGIPCYPPKVTVPL